MFNKYFASCASGSDETEVEEGQVFTLGSRPAEATGVISKWYHRTSQVRAGIGWGHRGLSKK